MKRLLVVVSAVLGACGGAQSEAHREAPPVAEPAALPCVDRAPAGSPAEQLDWMIGEWVSEEDGAVTTERWCAGEGGALVGDNHTRAGDRVVHSETLRVEARGDALVYVASPVHQATTEFIGHARCGSDELEGNCARSCEATFRNPEHDFPTEIVYGSCVGSGTLVATIRGGERRASWTFHRR